MKTISVYLFAFLCLAISSCNSNGKKVKISDHTEVYIKGDATEDEAKRLGTYIDTTWKDATNNKSFQLSKDSGRYTLRMVVDKDQLKQDSSLDESFRAIQFLIEENVFKGNKIKLILTDNQLNDLKSFDSNSSGVK